MAQASTVHKIWPDLITEFEVQLAEKIECRRDENGAILFDRKLDFPIQVEPKLDGLRLIVVKANGNVTLYTRNGSVLDTLPNIQSAIEFCSDDNFMLDGEVFGQNWNISDSIVFSSKNKKSDLGMEYYVFDALPLSEWNSKTSSMNFSERTLFASQIVDNIKHRSVKAIKNEIAHTPEQIAHFYGKCLEEKFEGVMLKKLNTPYEFRRTWNIMKLKPIQTVEGVIVGWFTGKPGTNRENLFNGFKIMLENGVVTDCGSGINNALRAQVELEGPDTYIGKIAECECAVLPMTSDGLTELGKMLFPVFVRFRNISDVSLKLSVIAKTHSSNSV